MATEAALSMLDGREFGILSAVIFSMGIFTGFVLSQVFCKSRGINVTINGKERRSHGDEEVNAKLLTKQLSESRRVEIALGPLLVLTRPPTFWQNWLEICRRNCSSLQPTLPLHPREGTQSPSTLQGMRKDHYQRALES